MALKNLAAWNKQTAKGLASTACGSGDKVTATACGSGDKAMPTACGSSCGANDK